MNEWNVLFLHSGVLFFAQFYWFSYRKKCSIEASYWKNFLIIDSKGTVFVWNFRLQDGLLQSILSVASTRFCVPSHGAPLVYHPDPLMSSFCRGIRNVMVIPPACENFAKETLFNWHEDHCNNIQCGVFQMSEQVVCVCSVALTGRSICTSKCFEKATPWNGSFWLVFA